MMLNMYNNNTVNDNNVVNNDDLWNPPSNLPAYAKDTWEYIGTRSYSMKYWQILRNALENGTFTEYNLSSVYAGELEFEDIRVKNNLPGYYQYYDLEFLEKFAGVSMCWRPQNVPFVPMKPTDNEIVEAIANAMNQIELHKIQVDNNSLDYMDISN
jgi:hypothetical protein